MTEYTRKNLDSHAREAARDRMKADQLIGRPMRISWRLLLDNSNTCLLVKFFVHNCEHPYLTSVAI